MNHYMAWDIILYEWKAWDIILYEWKVIPEINM